MIFKMYGANVVRVRLFNNPDPALNRHGDIADVTRTIRRAKQAGMQVLLDFHYSDTFADPGRQDAPVAWAGKTTQEIADLVYAFTFDTLSGLSRQGLMPELVQVGNETNSNIIRTAGVRDFPLDWSRNRPLFNAGIKAVRDAGRASAIQPKVILHVAKPENIDWWFGEATTNGVTDFDIIGVSYYPAYSNETIDSVGRLMTGWRSKFKKDILIVETGIPFTLDFGDSQNNLLYTDALEPGFAATPEGQRDFMIALTQKVIDSGGIGVIPWEPAWTTTPRPCKYAYGTGSPWENVTYFDFRNENNVHAGITWLSHQYRLP